MKNDRSDFFFISLIFLCITVVSLYPLFFLIDSHISGFFSTDEPYGIVWRLWWARYAFSNRLSYSNPDLVAYPFGVQFDEYKDYPIGTLFNNIVVNLTNEIIGYNLLAILSFLLTGIFMYYLVFFITHNKLISFFSALILTFCPYHFVRNWQHLRLAQIQWIPLYILTLVRLEKENKIINMLFLIIAFILVCSFDFYYAYFIIFITTLFIIILTWYKKFKSIKLIFISTIIGLLFILPSVYPIIKNLLIVPQLEFVFLKGYIRPFEDLFTQSAKPLSYLLPATVHPIFGKFTERFIGSQLYGVSFTEHTLYLGWVPLVLAFVAVRRWRRSRDFYIGFFIFLAIGAWFFSQPPWWKFGPIKIYMPSFFMYKILPMFRAYCRFGIVVMLAVAVLAGFGLKFILERFKSQKTKIALTCLFSGLVLFEFWNWPPYKVIDVSKVPAVYYWLKEEPGDFAIAEYPLDADSPNELYKFYQTKHKKKIINGTIPGTYANKVAQKITKLSDPKTAGILKWMKVKYVIVHREDYLKTELTAEIEELNKIPHNPGLKLIKSFPVQECPRKDIMCTQKSGEIDIYEVMAEPTEPRELQ